jgi:hypothetical protein
MKISEIIYQTLPREEKVFTLRFKTLKKNRSKRNYAVFQKEIFWKQKIIFSNRMQFVIFIKL